MSIECFENDYGDYSVFLKENNEIVSYMRYSMAITFISIDVLETYNSFYNNGYASYLIKWLLEKYNTDYEIKLICAPIQWSIFGESFEERKEHLRKFYEKFGFTVYESLKDSYYMKKNKI